MKATVAKFATVQTVKDYLMVQNMTKNGCLNNQER